MTEADFFARYASTLNPQQWEAVRAVEGQTLLLAVPGSGKTTVLITRLGYLLLVRGIAPETILTVTYTVAATHEMRRRFAQRFGENFAKRLHFRTINGLSAKVIQYYETAFGRKAFTLLEDMGEQLRLLSQLYQQVYGGFATESELRELQTAVTYVKNRMLTGEAIVAWRENDPKFLPFYESYQQLLRQRQWMDYDDQMVYAHRILRQYPAILQRFQQQYRCLCVDEAQDTSYIQYAILELLGAQAENLFLVGDEDQSIYGFRAAAPDYLLAFTKHYPQGRVLYLEGNYRSGRRIVTCADGVIRNNRMRHPKRMTAQRGDAGKVEAIWLNQRREQYAYLVELARNCTQETAVLYRDNDNALPILDLLLRHGIPFRCRQWESHFFTHPIVQDIEDFFRFAQDNRDGERFLRIYYKWNAGIRKEDAQRAVEEAKRMGQSVWSRLLLQPNLSDWTRRQCAALQEHCRLLLRENGELAVERLVYGMGYGAYLEQRGMDSNRVQILAALGQQEESVEGLLQRLHQLQELLQGEISTPESAFLLSTIHASKGLEYERVFLLDVMDGILPKQCEMETDCATQEEERRLLYVGMTRAKEELFVFRFRRRNQASRFALEIFPPTHTPSVTPHSPTLPPSAESGQFRVGERIVHRQFGAGSIRKRQGDCVELRFDDGSERRFVLSIALKRRQLYLEEGQEKKK